MSRRLIFDEECPFASRKHIMVFAEVFDSSFSDNNITIELYTGEESYTDGSVDHFKLTRLDFNAHQFKEFIEALNTIDVSEKT